MKHSLLFTPVFFFLFLVSGLTSLNAQQEKINEFLFQTPQIVYFGIDFSHAKIPYESPRHKTALYENLLQEINLKFLSEQTE